jgi:site-specific recombinase XerD
MPIEKLFDVVLEAARDFGLAEVTIRNNYELLGVKTIRKYYEKSSKKNYCEEITSAMLQDVSASLENGNISRGRHHAVMKVSSMIDEYVKTGKITHKVRCHGSRTILNSMYYRNLLSHYTDFGILRKLLSSPSIECEKIMLRHFFAWLESINCMNLSEITLLRASDFLTHFSKKYPKSIGKMISTLKKLYSFTQENCIECSDFTPALTTRPSPRKKLQPTLTVIQADSVLQSVNTNTPVGKRDYAIMMIAKHLGVRGGDIISMKLSDINWEKHELTFQQDKTVVDLILPLPVVVGNAIAEYILECRPKTTDEHIFVRHIAPFVKLDGTTNMFRRYDPDWKFERGTGFHSFRRGVASQMLNAGIEPDTVKGILGHTDIDSLKPYARISEIRLESCPLGLKGFETTQEELC